MRALVVYETMFGNTEAVAGAIAAGLKRWMTVDLVEVGAAPKAVDDAVDLLVVGAPTHQFGLSRSGSRRAAQEQSATPVVSASVGLREWLAHLPRPARPTAAAAFDTCVAAPRWIRHVGTAGRGATTRLRRKGFRSVAAPESFLVTGMTGPLGAGELERAEAWAATLAARAGGRPRTRRR